MRCRRPGMLFPILGFLAVIAQGAESTNPSTYRIAAARVNLEVKLTGRLTDPHWSNAPSVNLLFEVQPGENIAAAQKTTVKILYNNEYVYFGFECHDTRPSEIRAHVTDRDKLYQDDFAAVMLDTYADKQRAYEFFVNPFNVQGDAMRNGNNEDDTWDGVWYSAAALNDSGWTAEMAIPFKSLRFPPNKEQTWGLELGRKYPRASMALFLWTPINRNNPCFMCQGGTLEGIEDVESTTSVELLPYTMGMQRGAMVDTEDPKTDFVNGKMQGRIGGGVKYSPSPSLAVEAVVNPDFSQVESDAAQISVNNTFAIFYPEKRPFLLEGSDLYQTRIQSFYSRMINNPLGAVKVTQKSGAFSLAYLAAMDRNTPFIVPGEEESDFVESSLRSFSNILRTRYDFGSESFVGLSASTRNLSSAHNYVGGVDWTFLFGENLYFRGQYLYSNTKEGNSTSLLETDRRLGSTGHTAAFDGESYGGSALQAELSRQARNLSFTLKYMDFSPTFQAQNGFVANTDLRTGYLHAEYAFFPTSAVVDNWGIVNEEGMHFNYDGVMKERWALLGTWWNLKGQTHLFVGFFPLNEEQFKGVTFRKINRLIIETSSNPLSSLSLWFSGQLGRFIRREDSPELGTGHQFSVGVTIRPTDRLQLELLYDRTRLSALDRDELFYDGYIGRAVIAYQFTPALYVRAITQYNQFDKIIDIYPLVSYKLNPFTIFYIGSTHSMTDFGSPYGTRQTARQFFVKLQYLWRS